MKLFVFIIAAQCLFLGGLIAFHVYLDQLFGVDAIETMQALFRENYLLWLPIPALTIAVPHLWKAIFALFALPLVSIAAYHYVFALFGGVFDFTWGAGTGSVLVALFVLSWVGYAFRTKTIFPEGR